MATRAVRAAATQAGSSYRFGASVVGSDGRPLGFAARRVMNSRSQQNIVLPNVKRVTGFRRPRKPTSVTLTGGSGGRGWASWLGTPIGQGNYGAAFRCVVSDDVYTKLEMVRASSTFYVESKGVRRGQTVVIKLAKRMVPGSATYVEEGAVDPSTLDEWALDNIKEATWHKYLDDKACVALGPSRTCVSNYVPTFYWAGMMSDAASRKRVYVTVMGLAPGVSVSTHLERTGNTLSPHTYLQIERALASMWINGIVHADSHVGNLMYDARSNRITVIDFGFGALLTRDMVVKVRRALVAALQRGVLSLGEIWRRRTETAVGTDVQNYVDRIMAGRGFSWYNPDGHVLMRLASLVPRSQRALIPALRERLWGFRGSATRAPAKSVARAPAKAPRTTRSQQQQRWQYVLRRRPRVAPQAPQPPQKTAPVSPAVSPYTRAVQRRRRRWFPRIRFSRLVPRVWTRKSTPVQLYS